jgi:hypothetical protein
MARIVEELRSLEAHGVGDNVAQKLIDAGVAGLAHILEMTDEQICSIEGIGPKTAEKIREAAGEAKLEWDKRDALEAERAEAERLEAERLAAEQAQEEARRLAEEQAAEEQAAGEPAAAEAAGVEGEAEPAPALAVGEGSTEGGEPDVER